MNIISESEVNLSEIITALHEGQTIVYPTKTCYGLGCDATNAAAVERVFAIKKRQGNKPVLMLVPDVAMLLEYVNWNETLESIAKKYWPGALTIVLPLKASASLPRGVVGDDNTVAFRVTSHSFPVMLAQALHHPLVSTSANIAAAASPYDLSAVLAMFKGQIVQPDWLIDAGSLPHCSPSTIIRVGSGGRIVVLRQGDVIVE